MLTTTGAPLNCTFPESDWHLLASFWHPVAFDAELVAKPLRVTLLDVDLVLWRTATGISAAADYCPHRGTRMSLGYVNNGQLICKYHGLHFNEIGRCTRIPSSPPDAKIPRSLQLRTYPVVERYGLLWVCLKGEARAPLPDWPALTDPTLQRCKMDTVWNAAAGRHTENFLDTAHFSFAHLGTFGWAERPDVQDYVVEETEHSLSYTVNAPQQNGSLFLADRNYTEVKSEYTVIFPFASKLVLHFPRGDEIIFDVVSPISSKKSRIFMLKTRDHDFDHFTDEWTAFQAVVNEEDREMVESQIPHALPVDLTQEFHIPSDRISVAFRRRWREMGLQGDIV
jgi:vanillate O-demethylase monooxygenase subunit